VPGIIQTIKQFRSEGIEGYFAIKYAEFSKNTPVMRESYADFAECVADNISEGSFLEVGPGPSFVSIEIAKRLSNVYITGLDISETMIAIGRRNIAEANLSDRITFRLGDAAKMPFRENEFDFVYSGGSLHHWSKPTEVFNEIYRVLKPDRLALIYDARKDAPKEKIDEFSRNVESWFMRWGIRHSVGESYTQQGIEELLSRTHFNESMRIELDDLGMYIWLQKSDKQIG
jgi:ubiquinone/menaquinone biosynthesis C-methylase UbiE